MPRVSALSVVRASGAYQLQERVGHQHLLYLRDISRPFTAACNMRLD